MYQYHVIKRLALLFSLLVFSISASYADGGGKDIQDYIAGDVQDAEDLLLMIDLWKKDTSKVFPKIPYGLKGFEASKKFGLDSLTLFFSYKLATDYLEIDSISEAVFYADIAYGLREPNSTNVLLSGLCNLRGNLFEETNNIDKAIEAYVESIKYSKNSNVLFSVYPLGSLSELYGGMGDYEDAIFYGKKAAEITAMLEKGTEYYYNATWDAASLFSFYDALNNVDSAEFYYLKAHDLATNLEKIDYYNQELLKTLYENSIRYHLKRSNFKSAKKYLGLLKTYSDLNKDLVVYTLEASYYSAIDNKEAAFKALEVNKNITHRFKNIKEFLTEKVKIYEKYDSLELALSAQKELYEYVRKKINKDKARIVKLTAAQLENIQKQDEIDELRKEQMLSKMGVQKQKAYRMASVFIFLLLAFGITSFYFKLRRKGRYSELLEKDVNDKTRDLKLMIDDLAEKNEELKKFNYIVSHDLQEPIRSIVSFSNLLHKKSKGNKELEDYANYIVNSGTQLRTLVQDIATFQGLESKKFTTNTIDLNNLVKSVEEALVLYTKERSSKICYEQLPVIQGPRSAMFIIFQNLINNGIRYNQSGRPKVSISSSVEKENLLIRFQDNGIGIDAAYFTKVFEMFKRLNARNEYEGSGIGLASCAKLVKKMAGNIYIESSGADGTCFVLQLPKDVIVNTETVKEKLNLASA